MPLCQVRGCDRDARHRYACDTCTDRMRRQLRETEMYATIIRHTKQPGRGGTGTRRAPGYGSRSPADDTKISADDERTRSTGDGVDDRDDVMSIAGTIHGITAALQEELGETARRRPDLTRDIGWLLGHIDWCATQPWVADIADNLAELHAQTKRLAGDGPPPPVGPCLQRGCDGTVHRAMIYNPDDPNSGRIDGGRCDTCHHHYNWPDLVAVHRFTKAEAISP